MNDQCVEVRQAVESDAAEIVGLLAELGYPISVHLMQQKLNLISSSSSDCVFVAASHRIVGVISFHSMPLFHALGNLGRITSLVVSHHHRRFGIGNKLVAAAEDFARSNNCARIEVTSGDHRPGAHAFYQRIGYQEDERRFIKQL